MSNTQPLALTPPRVTTLPDIPGGQTGLLPVTATSKDLKVEFDQWPASNPSQAKETVRLFWDGVEGARRDWSAPITPDDLYVMLPLTMLTHGVHQLRYQVTKWDGNHEDSTGITLTVDKQGPVLAGNNNPATPPADLENNRVTARYLEQHDDRLILDVPAWDPAAGGPQPGDELTWYWETEPLGQQVAGSKTLSEADMTLPITVDGDLIRARGDGQRYVMFQVSDRAGNKSSHSRALLLEVKTARPPRQLPRPRLKGTSNTFLDPLDGLAGVMLEIPSDAVLDEDDEVFMQWGEPGTPGAWRVKVDLDTRQCLIPGQYVPAHLGSTLPVHYEALDYEGQVHTSDELPLRIQALEGMPALQCDGIVGDEVSIAEVRRYESQGVETQLWIGQWPFMGAGQFIRVIARSASDDHPLIDPQPVQAGQPLRIGRLSSTALGTLAQGALVLRAEVSFDGQQRWQAFKPAHATLRD